ncbi:MAG TPA: DinB family protein [Thermoanaerobaculia bacterium]|nr:DinB family protein [Thermoanaerobaculia bacterium]
MITLDLVRDLFDHMQWADAEVWTAVEAWRKEAEPGPKAERLMTLLQHLHDVQHSFLLMWTTGGRTSREQLTPEELQEWARAFYAGAGPFLASFDIARSHDIVTMPWLPYFEKQLGRTLQQPTFAETLVQVPMHSTYHRGQINALLRELGGTPPLVDYIAWVWLGKPAPVWP